MKSPYFRIWSIFAATFLLEAMYIPIQELTNVLLTKPPSLSTNLLSLPCDVDPGSLFKTRCMSCGHEAANYQSPICASLEGKG